MRYHSSLLKHYISINDSVENIANKLILKTCEVEEIIERNIPTDVLIGKVVSVHPHPQADKLVVCSLDCGAKWIFQICTGGENVVVWSYVPVATPGCYLPVIDLKIEPRKLRGEDSNGMICSKGELWINEDEEHHWIRTLQYAANTNLNTVAQQPDFDDISDEDCGVALGNKYPRLDAYIFDVDNKTVTHRPDLTGHFGLAWELNAMNVTDASTRIIMSKLPTMIDAHTYTSIDELVAHGNAHNIAIKNTCDAVQVYGSIVAENCVVQSSSLLTRVILRDCGSTPKNNWVDFSNITMLLTWQPVHCFDADTIVWWITVRYATDGEQFTDLMDIIHTLTKNDIVIADDKKVLALGWVIWGKESAITASTKRVLIEIAHFDSVAVRKTWTRLSLRTDAELRFEKHINPQYTAHALQMVLDLLQYYKKDLGSFDIAWISLVTQPTYTSAPKTITIDWQKISHVIFGDDTLKPEEGIKILTWLWYKIYENTATIPRRRSPDDMNWMHDIVEEVVRIYGYEKVAWKELYGRLAMPDIDIAVRIQQTTEDTLVNRFAYTQTETYPRLHEKYITLFGKDTKQFYSLQNAPAPELQYLRDMMLYGLVDVVIKNHKTADTIDIFDTGKSRPTIDGKITETRNVWIVSYRNKVSTWQDDQRSHVKNAVIALLRSAGVQHPISFVATDLPYYHSQKQCSIVVKDIAIWSMWQLHPAITHEIGLPMESYVTYADVNLDMISMIEKSLPSSSFETLQDQIVWRDCCFVIDQATSYQTLQDVIKNVEEVQDIRLFDLYAGDKLEEGKKSCAFSVKIQWDGTMTTEQINAVMQKVIVAGEATWAVLR
jgi:phenylalanyl-tRNA synthetase beta chain